MLTTECPRGSTGYCYLPAPAHPGRFRRARWWGEARPTFSRTAAGSSLEATKRIAARASIFRTSTAVRSAHLPGRCRDGRTCHAGRPACVRLDGGPAVQVCGRRRRTCAFALSESRRQTRAVEPGWFRTLCLANRRVAAGSRSRNTATGQREPWKTISPQIQWASTASSGS